MTFENADGTFSSIRPFSTPSILDQASNDLARLGDDQTLLSNRQYAATKLQEMSISYVSSALRDNEIWAEMKRYRRASDSFCIPEAPMVQELTQIFLGHLETGYPVFVKPQNVPEKAGW